MRVVPREEMSLWEDFIREMLEKLVKKQGPFDAEWELERIMTNNSLRLLDMGHGLFAICSVGGGPARILFAEWVWGKDFDNWDLKGLVDILRFIAKKTGCKSIAWMCRRGFSRKYKNFKDVGGVKHTADLYRIEV